MMTQTDVERRYVTGCWNLLSNETLTGAFWETMQELGSVPYDDEDRAFAADLNATIAEASIGSSVADLPEDVRDAVREAALYAEPIPPDEDPETGMGSTDVGDVSWITPTAQFRATTWAVGTPAHTWQAVAAGGDFGIEGALYAAKVLAGTAYDLFTDADLLAAAREEFAAATADGGYESPLPDEVEPPFDITAG